MNVDVNYYADDYYSSLKYDDVDGDEDICTFNAKRENLGNKKRHFIEVRDIMETKMNTSTKWGQTLTLLMSCVLLPS